MKTSTGLLGKISTDRCDRMGIFYENLDERTREFMVKEVETDVSNGDLYLSSRLTSEGQLNWATLLKEAICNYDDDWLANELLNRGYIRSHESRRTRSGGTSLVKVPVTAHETLAEGEFNRYYARGLCARALADGMSDVEVCRGKVVQTPRPESQAKIGRKINAKTLREDLSHSIGVEPALGIPPGPNSGLTIRLPK